ncbi:MAG: hypothetical protein N2507_04350, partial [Candidatus Bipolaricaulota bacterium]|nr:hypothetical protein [Candidatus Bipolaricaulota bacterium]
MRRVLMRIVALAALCGMGAVLALAQALDLTGPTAMGRCEARTYTVSFTAGVRTATGLRFTITRPNAGFSYVPGSGGITLPDGATVPAEPTPSGLDLVWDINEILGAPYELPPGETVILRFDLLTGCGTLSGTLSAKVDYVEEGLPLYLTDSQPIQILPGAALVYKEPGTLSAAVGDTVSWTLVVENTGLGPIYNVVVTDELGPGLRYVGSTPAGTPMGQAIVWEFPSLAPGERVHIELQAEVIACTGLSNKADVRFGCDDGTVCFDTAAQGGTASASVRLILKQPLLDWTPPNVQIPYCDRDGVTVVIPIRNVGEGEARNVRMFLDCRPLVVSEVGAGATYDNGWFYLENPIPPGGTFNLTFTVTYPGDWCTVVPSGTVICRTVYENVCGEPFFPPVKIGSFSTTYGPAGPPALNVSLTGPDEVYICTLGEYHLAVAFSGLATCGENGATSEIAVGVNVPPGFTVADAGGGTWTPGPDGTGGTIAWTASPALPFSTTLALRAPGTPGCGQVATLTATATAQDCCGCTLTAASSLPIAIECYQLVTSSHQAEPSVQEKCGVITYTHTYTFAEEGPEIYFTDLTFTAYAANAQEYVDGTLAIAIDGAPASPVSVVDHTPGGALVVQGIADARPVWGHTLEITYQLRLTPNAAPLLCPGSASFYTWTTLDLGPGCTVGDACTQPCQVTETLRITATTPSLSVTVTGIPDDFVDPCGTYSVTVTLTKTSPYDPRAVVLRLENTNYYIVDLDSVQVSGVQPVETVPTERANYYEWTYGDAFVGQPAGAQSVLTFQVRKRCGPGTELRATALYEDGCGGPCSTSGSDAPLFLRSPYLFVYKTPEVVYATQNTLTWTIYVVNSGSGYAHEVWVEDRLGTGLEYVSSSVSPSGGVTTLPNKDRLGNDVNGVLWRIASLAPGEQRVITLVARMVGCQELWNEVTVGLGCGGEECLPPVHDSSTVLVPSTQLLATSSTASPIPSCASQAALIRIRNTGDPAVYRLVVRETLPPGMEYVSGTTRWRKGAGAWQAGADPTITGSPWTGYTLEWTESAVPGLAELRARQTLEIEFEVRALCHFTGGDLEVAVDYVNVCGEPRSLPVGTFRVEARRPSLAIRKVQVSPPGNGPVDCEGTVTWRIDVTNTGPIPIPYVWVEDELGSGFAYVSSTGGAYGVDNGCNLGSLVTWALRNLPPGATAQLTLTARETGCGELRNRVRAWWGCGTNEDGSSCTLDADCLTDTYVFQEVVATRTPNVAVLASLSPTQIPACGTATMTLEIRNPSSATASALDVRIGLPAGLSYVPGTTQVDCGTGFTPAPDPYLGPDGFLYWYEPGNPAENLCPAIPPGGTIRLQFGLQAACYRTPGNAAVRVYFYDCCLESQRQFDASFALAPSVPNLTIAKTPVSVPLNCFDPNSTATWQIRVQNTGTASADWVRIEDTLGANLVYVGSNPPATPMGGQKWGWEFGPLGPGESRTVEITVRMTQPANNCSLSLRLNTAQAWWGCGPFDGDPNTVEGCTGGGPVTATAQATIPDVYLSSTDIVPLLTCTADGNYTGRVQITVRNAGDAAVAQDFRLTLIETVSGWSVSGYFSADFGGTLPIAPGGSRTITIPNWPVTCAQCPYNFAVILDVENALCECREDNNSASRAWTITLPDLTVRRHSLSLSCAGDGQARVFGTVTLGNEGCGSPLTANVPVRFTLRSGPGCTGTVLYSWTTPLTGVNIPAKGEQTFTISQTFPLDLCATGACTFSLLIEADPTGSICECDGTNNALCADLAWATPDLTVRGENLSLTCAGDGQVRISGTVTLGNEGCTPLTAPVPMRFVLREGPGCTGTVLYTWTATFTGVSIPAKGEQTFTVSHTFPFNLCALPGCTVSLLIEADYNNAICECSGTNNTRCVNLQGNIPDLRVTEVVPAVENACRPGTVRVTVENGGCGASPAGVVVRIAGDATGEAVLPVLAPQGATTVTVTLNEVLPCGSYTITATVDPDDLLCECSAANNVKDATFTVVDPDLTLTDLSVLCQGDGSFRVTATVRNVGTEASPATTARIYVDGVLAGSLAIPELPIGGMHPISWSSNRIKCGVDHLFRLVVDEANAICECQEGNNEVLTAARCGCPALVTDKAIAQILRAGVPVPTHSPVQPGDVITYTLQVTNVGTGWAFDVDLWDVLPVEFLYVAGSTSATWPGGSSTADPAGAPGPNLAWDLSATLRPGETLTLQFQAFVTSLARQDFRYTNAMRATGTEGDGTPIPPDSGLPGDTDPDDADEVVHPAAVPALALDKAIVDVLRGGASRGPAGPVEPGDVIVYTVTIRNVGFGVAYDVDFTDELPAHVEYETAYGDGTYTVDSPAAAGSLGIPDGATGPVTADISATIHPGGTLVATYRVRVRSSAAQGVDLVNRAVATGKDGAGTPIPEFNPDVPDPHPDRDSTRIGVVEPGLALDKEIVDVLRGGVSIWPTPIVLWGDVIVYRVTVRN